MWKKVVAPTALVSLLWIVVTWSTSHYLAQLDDLQTQVVQENRITIRSAGAMQENLWRLQAVLLEAAEHGERSGLVDERFTAEATDLEHAFELALGTVEDDGASIEEKALARTIEERFQIYRSHIDEWLTQRQPGELLEPLTVEESMHLARSVAEPCERLFELGQRLTNESFVRRDRLRAKVNMLRTGFVILGPAFGILLGIWVARGLHHSISQISVTLKDVSGDLEQEIGRVEVDSEAASGSLPGLQLQVQEVSGHIKQVVDELQKTRREAFRAERLAAVGELAAGVAHELRNPLTSVKLLIQMMGKGESDRAAEAKRLRVVQEEIVRMETTIQELLDFARPAKLRRVKHDVRDTLRRALNLVEGRAMQANVTISEELGGAPVTVDGDPAQLDQVFVNLLLNAIEAMTEGGELRVAIERDSHTDGTAPTGLVRIVFCDTGSGIPEPVMQRLFEPFVTSKERGIGLGLAISRRIVQEHGGQLSASNQPVRGAMFAVELPAADGPTVPPAAEGDVCKPVVAGASTS
ncbi:MAG TPA: ATP-binding protein [Pirellulales bacterium]|nr:ATP-binding protein [Pirellulales bacterium]